MNSGPRLDGTSVAVTGAGGIIGRAVVRRLLAAGARVIGVERPTVAPLPEIDWIAVDLTHEGVLRDGVFGEASACIHLAGHKLARVAPDEVRGCFAANTGATLEVAEACRVRGVRRLVFASTGHVYAPRPAGTIDEAEPLSPRSAYAASKVAAETVLGGYAAAGVLDCAFARMSNVYGAPPDPATIVGRAVMQALEKQPIALRTHDAVRDFIHIDDAAAALVALATCPLEGAEAFNLASEELLSTGEVAARVALAAERAGLGRLAILPPEANEPAATARFAFTTERLRTRTGWRPLTTFDEGLDRTFAACRSTT